MTDLNNEFERRALASHIKQEIDRYCATAYDGGFRHHLGASLIGDECSRKLWYGFRWVLKAQHDGRQMRLFNRGHREEERFIEWLRGIGFTIHSETDEGGQHRISASRGHFGGSLDGIGEWPAELAINEPFLCEFKTSGTGAKFENLKKNGVAKEKPQHFVQMSTYGKHKGFRFALYCCINKNDDDLYIEIVKLDWSLADDSERKADEIIFSQTPPVKISQSPAFFNCKFCDFQGVCHRGEPVERNCRSCVNAKPIDNAEWHCNMHSAIIPKEFLAQGCNAWKAITEG